MFESVPMTIIDGKTYRAAPSNKRKQLIPSAPGVYVWTLQLGRVGDGLHGGDDLLARVSDSFSHLRSSYNDYGRAGRYRRVHIYDDPPALGSSTAARLDDLLGLGHDDLGWVLALGTIFQRPLYVGKAIDLRSRLKDHFAYRTTFAKSLEPFGLNFNQVAVIVLPVGGVSMQIAIDDTDGQSSPADDQGFSDAQDSAAALSSRGDSIDSDQDHEADDEVLATDSPERQRDKILISIAESLLIRNLQPMFNKKVD